MTCLNEYRGRKRKEFEERIQRTRGSTYKPSLSIPTQLHTHTIYHSREWLHHAGWEASQNELARPHSIHECALDADPRSVQLWLLYTEMDIKSRNIQHV